MGAKEQTPITRKIVLSEAKTCNYLLIIDTNKKINHATSFEIIRRRSALSK